MLRNGFFLNKDNFQLSDKIAFSSVPHTCYYDHRSGVFTSYVSKRKLKCPDDQYSVFTPENFEPEQVRPFDELSLRKQYDSVVKSYDSLFGLPNRFDKEQNAAFISNIRDILIESNDRRKKECLTFIDNLEIDDYIRSREDSRINALHAKIRRFGRKSYMNRNIFNYFITVTRNDALFSDEETWKSSLLRYLGNLAFRYGAKFMGVFERGEMNGRLHFHALVYFPFSCPFFFEGFTSKNIFSDKDHKWKLVDECNAFTRRFGSTFFEKIDSSNEDSLRKCVSYMTKYVTKEPVCFYYSRGLDTERTYYVPLDSVYFSGSDCVEKYLVTSENDVYSCPVFDLTPADSSEKLPFAQ